MRKTGERPRVFIGLTEVAGYFTALEAGFRGLGIPCRFYLLGADPFSYRRRSSAFERAYQRVHRGWKRGSAPLSVLCMMLLGGMRLLLLVWALLRYDVFIFGFFTSFLWYRELPLLRLCGKKVIYVFLGSEVRPGFLGGNFVRQRATRPDGSLDLEALRDDTASKRAAMARVERWAHACINHPPTAIFHTKPFLLWYAVGFPVVTRPHTENRSHDRADPLRIVHAPSNPPIKGSDRIRACVARLQHKGHRVELVELLGRSNSEVLDELARCDLVIDELYSDTPLGGLGVEAASFGRCVVNGGYYGPLIDRDHPSEMVPPAAYCDPSELDDCVERLVVDGAARREIGERARRFVSERWNPETVAGAYLRIIRDDVPSAWRYDPADLRYFGGYGLPLSRLREVLSAYVGRFGIGALGLEGKPHLLAVAREMAGAAIQVGEPGSRT